jgi:hypothetical protein
MEISRNVRRKKERLPKIIPPRSVFRLVRSDAKTPDWKADVGRIFRIGYYSRQDGLDVIWLVNERGQYEQSTDRDFRLKYFEPVEISDESDLMVSESHNSNLFELSWSFLITNALESH